MQNVYRYQRGISLLSKVYMVLIITAGALVFYLYDSHTFGSEYTTAGTFTYPEKYAPSCTGKDSATADHIQHKDELGMHFNVTTPTNYQRDYAHPLLVVWAPSGMSEGLSERFTGLTRQATEAGYVVVHARSVPLGFKTLTSLSVIPTEVIESWCIDPTLVFYTGHSDGGTVSNALSVMPESAFHPRALAPSAMGMQGKDMAAYQCPSPTSVMLMHNKGDGHFPDYGSEVVQWWADCNQCSGQTVASDFKGCVQYTDCAEGITTLFCEAEGNHAHWPGPEHDPVRFFSSIIAADRKSIAIE
ncbi:MAG: poly(3-hydroxybutyrate) depolymerase [Gammaproteobacteria bacterium]|nr:poly(3-hydroxybutyrate) depolymerase [Gammaproteobacteria bacterium]MBQ0840371.1 poly(3-hydroxybutyrate) depolymerase [Gammaproteobacteria bacterium]